MPHVHILLVSPLGACDMAQAGADEHQGGVAVGEGTHNPGTPPDLAVEALNDVVRADPRPVLGGEIAVGQRLLDTLFYLLRRLLQFHLAQLGDGLLAGGLLALLCVDRLEHLCNVLHLGTGHDRKHVAVEVHRAALVFRVRKDLAHSLQHPQALVADNELYAVQATALQPLEEADPAGLVLLHSLRSAQNLPITVLIDRNRHQYGHVFVLSAPIPAQIDAVYIHIRILSALQRTVSPVRYVDIRLLVQLADRGRRYLAAPQRLRDVLHPAHRDTC